MIVANSGSEAEAADIFQEALIDIYKLSLRADFVLTCSFEAFLIIVCKRKWLAYLKSAYKKKVTNLDELLFTDTASDDFEEAEILAKAMDRENVIISLLEQLGEQCRAIIKACLREKRQEKVAADLGYTYAYLRKKKSMCMAEYSKMVRAHRLFKN